MVDATWQETAAFSDARGRREMERVGREQPDLLAYVLGTTEELTPAAHAIGVYVFLVIWRIFSSSSRRQIPRIKPAAIERHLEQQELAFAKLDGADPRFLDRAARLKISRQPQVFKYMIAAIMEAPDDPDDPVELTENDTGTLFFVLATAIEVLDEARERV